MSVASPIFTPKHDTYINQEADILTQNSPDLVYSPSRLPYRYSSYKPTQQTYSPYYTYQKENQNLSTKILQTVNENQIVESKVLTQHQDIENLTCNVEDKQRAWISLNNDLDRQIEEANKQLSSQRQAFVTLESFQINSHIEIVTNQANEIKNQQTLEDRNKALFVKINELESDMQEQIKNWKIKQANIKESNQNEIADLNKNFEQKLVDNTSQAFEKEESQKQTLEEHENIIWKLKQEGDLQQKQIQELANELKLRKENVKDAEEQLSHVTKEINNEKEMSLQEDLRHTNCINDYKNNYVEMVEIHKQIIKDLDNKINDLRDRKAFHKKQADSNEGNLVHQHSSITNDIDKRNYKHQEEVSHMNTLISSQYESQSILKNNKTEWTNNVQSLNIAIKENRINYDEEMSKLRNENETSLKERETKIESLSESVAKLQNECTNNFNDIRHISNEKNNMANQLINY